MSANQGNSVLQSSYTHDPHVIPDPPLFTLKKRDIAHYHHPLAYVPNELIYSVVSAVIVFISYSLSSHTSRLAALLSFVFPRSLLLSLSYLLLAYGLYLGLKVPFWLYCRFFIPHPHGPSPSAHPFMPMDPGGEQLLRSGCPHVIDRKTKKRILEEGRGPFSVVEFVYAPHSIALMNRLSLQLEKALKWANPRLAEVGRRVFYERAWSRWFINSYINAFHLSMEDYVVPEGGYRTVQDFFTRHVKEGARPIEAPGDERVIVSPCDGRVLVYNDCRVLEEIKVKGEQFSLAQLIGGRDKERGETVEMGGRKWSADNTAMALIRLNPMDYHRYHVPLSCSISSSRELGKGVVHSNQGVGSLLGIGTMQENHRIVVELMFRGGPSFPFFFIPIGASFVGSCFIRSDQRDFTKGEEVGNFAFGGSTIICLFPRECVQWDEDLLHYTQQETEVKVLQGQRIGRLKGI